MPGDDGRPLRAAWELLPALRHDGGEASVVELPQCPAARVCRVQPVVAEHGQAAVPALLVQYHVAVPGTDRRTVLSFSTPALGLAEEMAWLFDLVASSVHYVWVPTSGRSAR